MSRFYARRVDTTHKPIRQALEAIGASVLDLSGVGDNAPDLAVGWRHRTILFECKWLRPTAEGGRYGETPGQRRAREAWRGDAWIVVHTPEEAVERLNQLCKP